MKTAKWMMLLACAAIGAGLYAEDQKPERRPGRRPGPGPRMDYSAIFELNEEEKKAAETADAAVKEAVKKIRENALEEAKKIVGERFDAQMKAYKEAVARMKDEKQKNRAGRMIARMEENRDRIVTGRAAMMLMPEGRRPGFGGPEGRRPMMPPRPEKTPADK